jgi:hypothetical protein
LEFLAEHKVGIRYMGKVIIKFLTVAWLALGLSGAVLAQAESEDAPVLTLDISPAQIVAQAGSRAQALVRLRITPPFHINSDQPNDPALIPTSFTLLNPPPGIKLLAIRYPRPDKLEVKGEPAPWLVFNDQSLLGIELEIDASAPPGRYQMQGQLRYQACDQHICQMPDEQTAGFILQVVKNSHDQ